MDVASGRRGPNPLTVDSVRIIPPAPVVTDAIIVREARRSDGHLQRRRCRGRLEGGGRLLQGDGSRTREMSSPQKMEALAYFCVRLFRYGTTSSVYRWMREDRMW